jgi:hypothetical protein
MSSQQHAAPGNDQLATNRPERGDTAASGRDEASAHLHRGAYNAAFYQLGLPWHWDGDTYASVLCPDGERECLRAYLRDRQPHLLRAYDAEFLIDAIQAAKARCYETMTAAGNRSSAYVNWAELHQPQVGA